MNRQSFKASSIRVPMSCTVWHPFRNQFSSNYIQNVHRKTNKDKRVTRLTIQKNTPNTTVFQYLYSNNVIQVFYNTVLWCNFCIKQLKDICLLRYLGRHWLSGQLIRPESNIAQHCANYKNKLPSSHYQYSLVVWQPVQVTAPTIGAPENFPSLTTCSQRLFLLFLTFSSIVQLLEFCIKRIFSL